MNTDIAYKGLKYIIVWILLYFLVKYTASGEISEIDTALVVTVLTLLLCILDSMYSNGPDRQENMQGLSASGDLNVTGSMNSIVDNRKGVINTNNVKITRADQSDASSTVSSISSTLSSNPSSSADSVASTKSTNIVGPGVGANPSSGNPSGVPDTVSNLLSKLTNGQNNQMIDSSDLSSSDSSSSDSSKNNAVPNPSSIGIPSMYQTDAYHDYQIPIEQSLPSVEHSLSSINGTGKPIDHLYVDRDYLGQEVIFDRNQFGGTSMNQAGLYQSDDSSSLDDTQPLPEINVNKIIPASAPGTSKKSNNSDVSDIITINVPKLNQGIGIGDGTRGNNPDPSLKLLKPLNQDQKKQTAKGESIKRPNPTYSAINGATAEGMFVRIDKTIRSDINSNENSDMDDSVYDNPDVTTRLSASGRPLKWYEQAFNPRSFSGAENLDQIAVSGGKTRNDILVNEMIYSDFNRLPPSFNDKDFEYGYSFLPPKDWYPLPPYPPVCVSNKNIPVQPVYLDTTTMDLKEWHETQKITPPDSINTAFVTNELNSKV